MRDINQTMNKNFIRTFKLPIAVDREPYFSYFLNLLDPYYDTLRKFDLFKKAYDVHGELMFKYNANKLNETLKYLSQKPEYARFAKMDMKPFQKKLSIPKKELYTTGNEGRVYISIDLVKANFQSLKLVEPTLFDGYTAFNDFAVSRGFDEVLLNSKITRQVIFGGLSPARQQSIQQFMMENIIVDLMNKGFNKEGIYSLSSDEMIFEDAGYNLEDIKDTASTLGYEVRVERFDLVKPFEKAYFVKEGHDGSREFKMVTTAVMAEFIKKYEGRPLEDVDLYFYDENKRLSKFIETSIF